MAGSGVLKPDLGAQRVQAISTSQGFAPERIPDSEADVFRVTLDPGNVVTFVGEQSNRTLPGLSLWEPAAYKDYVNSYTFFRGIVLGIAGLLALFLVILFVVKGAAMFPAAALLAWSVLAYLAIDFGFMGRLFDIPTASEPIWRAVAEVVFSASILILLFTYLTLHRWHVRYLHATGIWLVFLIVVLGIAFYDPSLGAGIARLSMVVTSVAGFAVILYLAYTGFDRAIMLIPTWILLLFWLLASGVAVSGIVDNDLVQPALSGGLVLLVLLFCFTIMQHAFSGGILAQGIVSDSERRALAIVGSGDMVWDWDVPRDRIHTSRDAEKLLGLKRGALGGHARDWLELLHPRDRDRFSAMLDAIIEQRRGRVNQDFRLRAEDGHYHWFKLRARPVVGTDGEVVRCVGTLLDITDQRTAEARLLHDAVHDNLTGLANRELLHDRLTAAMVRTQAEGAAKPAVLLVDIDNFRHINDNYGLSIGDSILLTVARRLSRLLKPQDSIARFYGDQFAIILISEQQPERIAVFADSVKKVLKVPIVFGERELTLGVSIGIAIHDVQAHKSAGDVVNDSELALYHAKRMGGDRIEPFRPSLRQQGRGRGSLDKDLVAALDRDEIEVVFQPIVDLNDRMIKGFEALARWNHPQRGNVPPSDFIPAAERTGLIVPMGIHVMEQAARQLNKWQQKMEGMEELFMSVNVSSQQLLRHDLINDVKTILSRCNVNPGTLKLELTESLVMGNPEYASQVLDKLRELGAGLSLDDFGTGYSSLSYLQHFPFDTLKIDKSFVGHDRGVTPVILRSIVKLAHDLRLNLVAEGIEDEEAAEQLVEMGCPLGQGYLFGKPLAPADAAALLLSQIEHHRQLKEEALARRRQAEAEVAARKAEDERKRREEQRRKEIEELERKQAHARQIAAQSLPKPEPLSRPHPVAKAETEDDGDAVRKADSSLAKPVSSDDTAVSRSTEKDAPAKQAEGDADIDFGDALENQLAASLAADLAKEDSDEADADEPVTRTNVPISEERKPAEAHGNTAESAQAKPDDDKRDGQRPVEDRAEKDETSQPQTQRQPHTVRDEDAPAQSPVERLADRVNGLWKRDAARAESEKPREETEPRKGKEPVEIPDSVLAGLEMDLQNALGVAAAEAGAERPQQATPPMPKMATPQRPGVQQPQTPAQSQVRPHQPPKPAAPLGTIKDDGDEEEAPKTTLRERMEATTSLFVKSFRRKSGDAKKEASTEAAKADNRPAPQPNGPHPHTAPRGPAIPAPQGQRPRCARTTRHRTRWSPASSRSDEARSGCAAGAGRSSAKYSADPIATASAYARHISSASNPTQTAGS